MHGAYCSYALESAAKHIVLTLSLVEHYRGQMTLRYLPVRYEDIVDDQEGSIRRIGIIWAGRPTHHDDRNGSTTLATFAPLTELPNTALVSLQKGPLPVQIGSCWGMRGRGNWKEAWIMLPYAPDWRWLLDRSDSPWYPSLRLFRQGPDRSFTPVMAAIVERLAASERERPTARRRKV